MFHFQGNTYIPVRALTGSSYILPEKNVTLYQVNQHVKFVYYDYFATDKRVLHEGRIFGF